MIGVFYKCNTTVMIQSFLGISTTKAPRAPLAKPGLRVSPALRDLLEARALRGKVDEMEPPVARGLVALVAPPAPQGLPEVLEQRAPQVRWWPLEAWGRPDLRDLRVCRGESEALEPLEPRALLDQLVALEPLEPRASGSQASMA